MKDANEIVERAMRAGGSGPGANGRFRRSIDHNGGELIPAGEAKRRGALQGAVWAPWPQPDDSEKWEKDSVVIRRET